MTYGDAYLAGWKNIFNYNGVATRFEFWSFIIGSAIICLLPLLSWLFAITIDDDYGAFIFFCAAHIIYFNVDFCRAGNGVRLQKDARYRTFRMVVCHRRVDPLCRRNSVYTVLPAVKTPRAGIMTDGVTQWLARHAFH